MSYLFFKVEYCNKKLGLQAFQAVELLSEKKVVAVTINHENLTPAQARDACTRIRETTGLPAVDVLLDGASELVEVLDPLLQGVRA